jgi:hypothetical protein
MMVLHRIETSPLQWGRYAHVVTYTNTYLKGVKIELKAYNEVHGAPIQSPDEDLLAQIAKYVTYLRGSKKIRHKPNF